MLVIIMIKISTNELKTRRRLYFPIFQTVCYPSAGNNTSTRISVASRPCTASEAKHEIRNSLADFQCQFPAPENSNFRIHTSIPRSRPHSHSNSATTKRSVSIRVDRVNAFPLRLNKWNSHLDQLFVSEIRDCTTSFRNATNPPLSRLVVKGISTTKSNIMNSECRSRDLTYRTVAKTLTYNNINESSSTKTNISRFINKATIISTYLKKGRVPISNLWNNAKCLLTRNVKLKTKIEKISLIKRITTRSKRVQSADIRRKEMYKKSLVVAKLDEPSLNKTIDIVLPSAAIQKSIIF